MRHFVENGELPQEIVALLQHWTVEKERYRAEDWGKWPAKLVETLFTYKGKRYSITQDMIGLEDNCWDAGFMEALQPEITQDLEKLGATDIFNNGFLD